jgi:putative zinc finger protein
MSNERFGDSRRDEDRTREEKFVNDVLDRTSGSPCRRAAELLPDLNDGVLVDLDRQLVQAHLEHCTGCRTLAVTLGWLDPLLPKMAELDPGPAFTDRVLARTTQAALGVASGPVTEPGGFGPAGVMDRLGRWWEQQILRPIFPVQVAYAATVVLVLLVGTPLSPFREAPGKILESVQAGPRSVPMIGRFVDSAGPVSWAEGQTEQVYRATREGTVGIWRRAGAAVTGSFERSAPDRRLMTAHLGALASDLGGGRLSEAGYEMHQFMKSGRRAWTLWWNDGTSELPNDESIADQP